MNKINYKKTISIVIFLSLIVVYIFYGDKYNFYIPCFLNEITNLYCPGCGITRMFLSIISLDFYQAFRYNPAVFILLPFLSVYYLEIVISKLNGKESILEEKIPNYIWYILLILVVVFGILRNIPLFDFLKPTLV